VHGGRVDLGDLDVERGDPATDGRFVMELLDRSELLLHLAEQLERWRQDRELLALDELLHPHRQVVVLIEIGKRLSGPRQGVEGALFPGDTDLLVDPRLPARSRRLALRHGAQLLARSIAPREQHRAVAQYRTRPYPRWCLPSLAVRTTASGQRTNDRFGLELR